MITFLIGALVGLIFLAGYLINSKTPNSANALVKPKEETAPEEKGPKSLTSTKRSNELPCEVNPLERVFQLFNQLPEIKTKTLKYLRERAQVERFENIIQEIGFELEEFDVEPCVESLLSFAPVHTGHSFRLESKLNEY